MTSATLTSYLKTRNERAKGISRAGKIFARRTPRRNLLSNFLPPGSVWQVK
jgi:hypothetical protein